MQPTQTFPGAAFRATVELAGGTAAGVRVPDKAPETRARRIGRAVAKLRNGA